MTGIAESPWPGDPVLAGPPTPDVMPVPTFAVTDCCGVELPRLAPTLTSAVVLVFPPASVVLDPMGIGAIGFGASECEVLESVLVDCDWPLLRVLALPVPKFTGTGTVDP